MKYLNIYKWKSIFFMFAHSYSSKEKYSMLNIVRALFTLQFLVKYFSYCALNFHKYLMKHLKLRMRNVKL